MSYYCTNNYNYRRFYTTIVSIVDRDSNMRSSSPCIAIITLHIAGGNGRKKGSSHAKRDVKINMLFKVDDTPNGRSPRKD